MYKVIVGFNFQLQPKSLQRITVPETEIGICAAYIVAPFWNYNEAICDQVYENQPYLHKLHPRAYIMF